MLPDLTGDRCDETDTVASTDEMCMSWVLIKEEKVLLGCRCLRINNDVNIAMRAESVSLADESVMIQRDAMLMARIQFTGCQHQFKLFHH